MKPTLSLKKGSTMDTLLSMDTLPSNDLLQAFAKRVGSYDRENRFFKEDFEDLRKAGYLTMNIPKEFGGKGLSLAEVCRRQRRLAYYAPATALGVNMHVYWVGVAADLWRSGDKSLEWILTEAAAGEIFAAGHAERGNDIPLLLSTAKAERVAGGFKLSGHKMFGSLAPVWTRYGVHALWADADGGPKIVHAFMPRSTKDYRIVETWDTLGMRGTRSDDVVLEGAFVPDKYVSRILPAGGADAFIVAVFAWALMGFANVYYGVAQRAFDLAIERVKTKKSMAVTRTMAYHPEVQHAVAEMGLSLDTIGPHLDHVAKEWSDGVDHGATWPAKIVSAKHHAVEACWRIVDLAMEVSGGSGMFKTDELERLFRDARCGRFHPANAMLVHEIVAKTALGIDLGEQPRWG
jgi:alkylation response protein AidB-like acyl-CoA dehydrogenase